MKNGLEKIINTVSPVQPADMPHPPLTRKYSVNQDFNQTHPMWQSGYDGFLSVANGVEVVEASHEHSNNDFLYAEVDGKEGYIPRALLDQ